VRLLERGTIGRSQDKGEANYWAAAEPFSLVTFSVVVFALVITAPTVSLVVISVVVLSLVTFPASLFAAMPSPLVTLHVQDLSGIPLTAAPINL
jgi:hypothetical protein